MLFSPYFFIAAFTFLILAVILSNRMKVAIFYDSNKYEAASAIKNIIISHNCDVVLYDESEIWKSSNSKTPQSMMNKITHVFFIYSKDPVEYSGFIFFSGYAAGCNIPILVMKNDLQFNFPKKVLNMFVELTPATFDIYFEAEKKRFTEIQKKENARSKLLEKGYSLFNINFIEIVKNNETAIAKLFIEAGFNPSERDSLGTPVLSLAVRNRCLEMVKLLVKRGAVIDLCSKDRNYSALMDAAQIGELKPAKILLEHGANPNIQSKNGQTALILAVGRHDSEMVKLLMQYKADYNIKDCLNMSALEYAGLLKDKNILKILEGK